MTWCLELLHYLFIIVATLQYFQFFHSLLQYLLPAYEFFTCQVVYFLFAVLFIIKIFTQFYSLLRTVAEVGTCAAIIAAQACGETILLAIVLAPQLFLNGCTDACAVSILAILSAIAQPLSNTVD